MGLQGRTKIFRRDATALGETGTIQPFDIVFADPPYGKGLGERALASAIAGGWLRQQAFVMVEEASGSPFHPPAGLKLVQRRDYGDTTVTFCERA